MATAEQYAEWIIANQDKKGTPEFETVAAAYRMARGQVKKAREPNDLELANPTDGMSGLDKFRAGIGKAFVDLGRGVGQIAGVVDQKDVDEAKRLDSSLMDTGAGFAGNLVGNLVPAAATAAIPGANTVAGGAALSGVLGALQPVGSTDSRLGNAALSTILGGTIPAATRLYGATKAAVIDPFSSAGRDRIAGGVMRDVAADPDAAFQNLINAQGKTAGFMPTAGQAANDAGIATLERTARAINPSGYDDVLASQRKSLADAVRGLGGDDAAIAGMKNARNDAVESLYAKAKSAVVPEDDELASLMGRPAIQQAFKDAQVNALNAGRLAVAGQTVNMPRPQWASEALTPLPDEAYFSEVAGDVVSGGKGKSLLQQIQSLGGIKNDEMLDILGEKTTRAARVRPGMFNKQGQPLDELASRLNDLGYLPDEDMAVDGGVQWLRDAIKREVDGDKIFALNDIPIRTPPRTVINNSTPALDDIPHYFDVPGKPVYSGEMLHNVKMAIDGARNVSPVGGANMETVRNIGKAGDDYLSWLQSKIPAYGEAKNTYAAMSKPINSAEVGNALGEKFIPALYRDMDAPLSLNYDALARAVRNNGDDIAANVTGYRNAKLAEVLGQQKMKVLDDVLSDAEMVKMGELLGKGGGSDTIQKMAMSNVLNKAGVPTFMQDLAMTGWVKRAGDLLYGNADEQVRNRLAEALRNPKEAAQLMKAAGVAPSKIAQALKALSSAAQAPMFALPAIMNAE